MSDFSDGDGVRQLVSELRRAFNEPNDLLSSPQYSPDREDFVRSVIKYTGDNLPVELLDDLTWRLVTTVGTPQTLRHYLPRIFEEALLGNGLGCTDWWVLAGKLPMAGFDNWTAQQRQLTLAAIKLWIANDEVDLSGTGIDATAILQMPIKDVIGLYDPHYDSAEPWWGMAHLHSDTIKFLVDEDDRSRQP